MLMFMEEKYTTYKPMFGLGCTMLTMSGVWQNNSGKYLTCLLWSYFPPSVCLCLLLKRRCCEVWMLSTNHSGGQSRIYVWVFHVNCGEAFCFSLTRGNTWGLIWAENCTCESPSEGQIQFPCAMRLICRSRAKGTWMVLWLVGREVKQS